MITYKQLATAFIMVIQFANGSYELMSAKMMSNRTDSVVHNSQLAKIYASIKNE